MATTLLITMITKHSFLYHHEVITSQATTVPDYIGYHWSLLANGEINSITITTTTFVIAGAVTATTTITTATTINWYFFFSFLMMTLTHWQSPLPLGLQRSISDSSLCLAERGTRCNPQTDVDATTFAHCCIHRPHHQLPPLRTWRPVPETTSTPCSLCHLCITHSHTKFKQAVLLLHKVLNGLFYRTRQMTYHYYQLPTTSIVQH